MADEKPKNDIVARVGAVVLLALGGWVSTRLEQSQQSTEAVIAAVIDEALPQLRTQDARHAIDYVTVDELRLWALDLQRANPGMVFVDPEESLLD